MGGKGFTAGRVVMSVIGCLLLFYMGNRITEHVRLSLAAGVEINDMLPSLPAALLADPLRVSLDQLDLIVGAALAMVGFLGALYSMNNKLNTRPGEEQGSAAWAQPRDIAPFTDKRRSRRLQLTRTEALSIDTRKTQRNLNVLVLGASGTRKTRSYVMPNLMEVELSAAVTDPKGEIYRETAPQLEARGHKVRTVNLVDLLKSDCFNPFDYFSETEPETSIAQMVETIIMNTSGKDAKGDGFWERAERALLTALVAYVWATVPRADGKEPNLPAVLDLQKGMQGSESNPDQMTSDTDLCFAAARQIVDEWRTAPGDEDETTMKVLDFACRQYRVYEQGPAETRMSVVISLGVRLAPLDMHDVRRILSTDTVALDRLGFELTTLFLQIPDTHTTFRFIAAMFWQSLFEKNLYQADHQPTGTLPVPVHAFLDEFANIGKIPGFEQLMATIRSRGMSASIVVQSYSQGKAIWKEDWDTIVANCDTTLFLGGRDLETGKWLSQLLGDETVISREVSRSYGSSGSMTRSDRTVKRALMTPDEIGRLPNNQALVLIRGLRPFKSQKVKI